MSLLSPQAPRLGRYQLLRRLASGGTAEVLLAQVVGSAAHARTFAIKRLLPQFAADPELARMFANEARLLGLFDHPNIVRMVDFGTDSLSGQSFLVMEHIDGLDLRDLMRGLHERGQRVEPGIAARIMMGVLDGLGHAHQLRSGEGKSMQVVHRDVSPQNILVSLAGVPKLIDFGVVKAETNEGDTKTGQLKGSVAYMAPEQIGGRALDGRADLFAVGVCLYELVTGINPFRRNNELATFNALLDEQPGPMSKWAPDCPPELEEVVRGALAKHRDGRYRTAGEMHAMLGRVPGVADDQRVAHVVRGLRVEPAAETHVDHDNDGPTALDIQRPSKTPLIEIEEQLVTVPPSMADTLDSPMADTVLPWVSDSFDGATIAEPPRAGRARSDDLSPGASAATRGAGGPTARSSLPLPSYATVQPLSSRSGPRPTYDPRLAEGSSAEHETAVAAAAIMPRGPDGTPLLTVRGTPDRLTATAPTERSQAGATEAVPGPTGPLVDGFEHPRDDELDAALQRARTAAAQPPSRDRVTVALAIALLATLLVLFAVVYSRTSGPPRPPRPVPVSS